VALLLFFNVRKALLILLAYALSGAVTQLLKYGFFDDVNRPFFYSSYRGLILKIVEGVDMHIHNSFPSGHSTAAFSLFICFCFVSKNQFVKFGCFILALFVAFSRVYLSQHFFEDIYAGCIIAVIFASLVYYLLFCTRLAVKLERLDKPVYRLFSKNNA
jgi:membrane-associated phospholipid phosphatase